MRVWAVEDRGGQKLTNDLREWLLEVEGCAGFAFGTGQAGLTK